MRIPGLHYCRAEHLYEHSKSQLAIETTYRVRRASPETFVFWLHASSTVRLKQSIKDTLEQVQAPGISDSTANVFQLFRAWLLDRRQRRTWLIVLDNADDAQILRQHSNATGHPQNQDQVQQSEQHLDYLPVCEHGTLLATSRNRAAALHIVSLDGIINIGPMDETHGIAMLQKKLGPSVAHSVAELSQLAAQLDSMPLAMAQAAAYIRQRSPRCSVRQYLNKLSSRSTRLDILNYNAQDLRRDRGAQHCVLKTWQISFDQIRRSRSSATDLLSLMSFFDRNSIPEALLHNRSLKHNRIPEPKSLRQTSARPSFWSFFGRHSASNPRSRRKHDKQHPGLTRNPGAQSNDGRRVVRSADTAEEPASSLEDDIHLLQDYSLVTFVASPPSFEMHRLVQLATQDWLKTDGSFERWGSQFMINLDEALPETADFIIWSDAYRSLSPHAFAAMDIEPHNWETVLRQASILAKAARFLSQTGAYTDSRNMNEQALEIRIKLLGPDHVDTVNLMWCLGVVYVGTQQHESAVSMLTETLNRCRRLWGKDHELILRVMHDLASAYSRIGQLVDAEMMQAKVLGKLTKKYGEEHVATLAVMIELTNTASKRGKQREAEELANRVLEIARKLHTGRHPQVLRALNSQARTRYDAGRYEEARSLANELFLLSSEVLGDDHPETLASGNHVAYVLYALGQRPSALDLLRDCAGKSERKLGSHHPLTIKRYELLRKWEAEDRLQETAEDENETVLDERRMMR